MCIHHVRLLLLLSFFGAAPLATAADNVDLRVLIDVSGSMKHNDPANLRRPALRLLAGLLPPTASTGIWLFGRDVKVLVPHGSVDAAWKARAQKAAGAIHSRAQFTNIESALKVATADWKGPAPGSRREVIILTDGIVDVPGGKAKSAESRARILDTELKRLHADGAHINTIALSDQADAELLKKLASATDGRYELVTDAATLERVFLKMFQETTAPDTLPVSDNRFDVDASVQQLTLVIFTKPGEAPPKLVLPDGSTRSQADASPTLRWHHEQHYELVTVDHPPPGKWRIDAHVDPDNRALIVTDLSLKVSQSSAEIVAGQTVDYAIALVDHDTPLTKPELLDQVKIEANLSGGHATSIAMAIVPGTQKGSWRAIPGQALTDGRYEVTVTATAPTFTREYRHSLTVNPAAAASAVTASAPGPATLDGTAAAAGMVNKAPVKAKPGSAPASGASTPEQHTTNPAPTDPPAGKAAKTHHALGGTISIVIIVLFNILLLVSGFFAYRYWKRRSARMQELEQL